ncbi:chondroitin AC/alginate lyase [Trametopsis cervina]|nr:chondroitin AC/alginate lyase [Trametopsis cervina]
MSIGASALFRLLLAVASVRSAAASSSTYVHSLVNYADLFVDPTYVLSKNYSENTIFSQQTILQWAEQSTDGGPWSVTTKQYLAPSGDKHDYMSWAPYAWPDCTLAGNTTELTPQQIWTACDYVTRDGEFNPDNSLIPNSDDFDSMANAVLFNSLSWAINGSDQYSSRVTTYIKTWFLDADTYMNPNLNYGQMQRGPKGQNGTHTGVLDLKSMAKVVNGVLILRNGKAPEWTADIDGQFVAWSNQYIGWLQSSPIALKEKASTNNHGSYFATQLSALQILVGDTAGAQGTLNEYFGGIFQGQIDKNGDQVCCFLYTWITQPLESSRTRPFHYRAYNLAAMITNARLAKFVGIDAWTKTTNVSTDIESALKFAMSTKPSSDDEAQELYPHVAAVASVYGDPNQSYVYYLSQNDGSRYVSDPTFFLNQPLSDRGYAALLNRTSTATAASPASTGKHSGGSGASSSKSKSDSGALASVSGLSVFSVFVCALIPSAATLSNLL